MASINGKIRVDDKQPVALPAYFFSDLMPVINDLAELKVTIFAQAALQQKEGDYRFLRINEFAGDMSLMSGLAIIDDAATANESLAAALEKAVERGTLLVAEIELDGEARRYYTAADDDGSALQRRIQDGEWKPSADGEIELLPLRPSVYGLYEDNIGVLTPMIVDSLKDAEATYPPGWIEDAIRLAVERNVRHWRYISGILERWEQEGRWGENVGDILDDAIPTDPDNGKPTSNYREDYEFADSADFVCYDPANRDLPCPLCDGKGVYTLDVSISDPRFGRFQRCPNHPVEDDQEMHKRLRRFR